MICSIPVLRQRSPASLLMPCGGTMLKNNPFPVAI